MSDKTLFALTGQSLALERQIDETAQLLFSDDPAEVAQATSDIEALITAEVNNRNKLEAKADACCWVIDKMRAKAAAQKTHARRLAGLATKTEHHADALQNRLIAALLQVFPDKTAFTLPKHKLNSRKTTTIEVDPDLDPKTLPSEFQRVTYEVDKIAVKNKIQAEITAAVAGLESDEAAKFAAIAATTTIHGVSLVERRKWMIN